MKSEGAWNSRGLETSGEAASAQRYLKSLQEDGYCLIENLIPQEQSRELCRYFMDLTCSPVSGFTVSSGVGFLSGGVNCLPQAAEYLAAPLVVTLAEMLFRSAVRISYTTLLINYSGAGKQPLHADWPFDQTQVCHIKTPYADVPMHLTSLWALTPPVENSGGTVVVPGSHRLEFNPTVRGYADDGKKTEMTRKTVLGPQGSALIMDSRLWHGRAENRSDCSRVIFCAGYSPWWLNLEPLRPGPAVAGLHDTAAAKDIRVPLVPHDAFERFSGPAKALFAHWL